QYSGTITLTFQAATQESDGGLAFGAELPATLTVTPVSDAPLLITPSAVSGLIADASVDSLAIPIQSALVDSSETLSVKVWVKGLTSTSAQTINFKYGSETTPILLKVGVLNNESVYFFEAKTAAELAKLSTLNVSATSDFRLDNKLSLLVESSSKDTGVVAATVSKTIDLSIYRPVVAPTLDLDPALNKGNVSIGESTVQTKSLIPLQVDLPSSLPVVTQTVTNLAVNGSITINGLTFTNKTASTLLASEVAQKFSTNGIAEALSANASSSGYSGKWDTSTYKSTTQIAGDKLTLNVINYDDVSVLVTGAPPQAYFTVLQNSSYVPVGASLGGGDGVWLFKASDIINSDGTSKKLVLINGGADTSGTLSAQAFIADPRGGTTASSNLDQYKVTFSVLAQDKSDPLILSLSGDPIRSSVITGIEFDIDPAAGVERPTYWVTGDAKALSGFAYLVKPGVTE
ncbi:MAG: hypothetical protein EB103_06755, partial [Actinobacteria bacterium]|nr:hypothetical protein [Actinomycetota bacterium]